MSLLTTKQAAPLIGCAAQTLNQARTNGSLFGVEAPPYKKLGKWVRYDETEIREWLSQFKSQTNTIKNT